MFKTLVSGEDIVCFGDVFQKVKALEFSEQKLIENIIKIIKLLAVNPASSTTAERTFSLARRVKNWMRSTMLSSRFNAISVLNFHKTKTDELDLISIANSFVSNEKV